MKNKIKNMIRNTTVAVAIFTATNAFVIGGAYLLCKLEEPKDKDKKNFYIVSRMHDPMYHGVTGIRRMSLIAQSPARDDSPYMRYYNYLVVDRQELVKEFHLNPENEEAYTYKEACDLIDADRQITDFWRKKR